MPGRDGILLSLAAVLPSGFSRGSRTLSRVADIVPVVRRHSCRRVASYRRLGRPRRRSLRVRFRDGRDDPLRVLAQRAPQPHQLALCSIRRNGVGECVVFGVGCRFSLEKTQRFATPIAQSPEPRKYKDSYGFALSEPLLASSRQIRSARQGVDRRTLNLKPPAKIPLSRRRSTGGSLGTSPAS